MDTPYRVYCGLQDNGVWGGPSASLDPRGITNEDWVMIGGGDGFFVRPDPTDPDTVYSNSQMNGLQRYDAEDRAGEGHPAGRGCEGPAVPVQLEFPGPHLRPRSRRPSIAAGISSSGPRTGAIPGRPSAPT